MLNHIFAYLGNKWKHIVSTKAVGNQAEGRVKHENIPNNGFRPGNQSAI